MYLDFQKTLDIFLFWEVINDVVVPGEDAFKKIIEWIKDSDDGPVRTKHKNVMSRLTEYMGYSFPDFDTYKKNLVAQLRDNVSPIF